MGRSLVKGTKVRKAQHVIPVDMGDEKMNIQGLTFCRELVPEGPDPCSRINDNNPSTLQRDLKTSGVAAIKDGFSSGNSNGTARAPKLDSHKPFPGKTGFRLLRSRQPAENVFKFEVIAV
jgi:hypothetical protein